MKNNVKTLKKKVVSYGELLALAERRINNRENVVKLNDIEAFEAELRQRLELLKEQCFPERGNWAANAKYEMIWEILGESECENEGG